MQTLFNFVNKSLEQKIYKYIILSNNMRNEKSIVLLENLKGNLTKYIYIYI